MYYNLITLLPAQRSGIRSLAGSDSLILSLFLLQDGGNSCSDSPRLQPPTICERRVIRSGRREMPLLVCGIEALSVPDYEYVSGWFTHSIICRLGSARLGQVSKIRKKCFLQQEDFVSDRSLNRGENHRKIRVRQSISRCSKRKHFR